MSSIKNTKQKVSSEYYNNPFWWDNKEEILDYELELIYELHEAGFPDEEVLIKALEYLGWDKLVNAYKQMENEE